MCFLENIRNFWCNSSFIHICCAALNITGLSKMTKSNQKPFGLLMLNTSAVSISLLLIESGINLNYRFWLYRETD